MISVVLSAKCDVLGTGCDGVLRAEVRRDIQVVRTVVGGTMVYQA